MKTDSQFATDSSKHLSYVYQGAFARRIRWITEVEVYPYRRRSRATINEDDVLSVCDRNGVQRSTGHFHILFFVHLGD